MMTAIKFAFLAIAAVVVGPAMLQALGAPLGDIFGIMLSQLAP